MTTNNAIVAWLQQNAARNAPLANAEACLECVVTMIGPMKYRYEFCPAHFAEWEARSLSAVAVDDILESE